MTSALVAGLGFAATAYVLRAGLLTLNAWSQAPRAFYKGGFLSEMTKREASLILGLRETSQEAKIKEAHRRIMMVNHPDAGGSAYLASKVNEAKDIMLGKKSSGGPI